MKTIINVLIMDVPIRNPFNILLSYLVTFFYKIINSILYKPYYKPIMTGAEI